MLKLFSSIWKWIKALFVKDVEIPLSKIESASMGELEAIYAKLDASVKKETVRYHTVAKVLAEQIETELKKRTDELYDEIKASLPKDTSLVEGK
jgi:predicted secreted Zn-dependent protease